MKNLTDLTNLMSRPAEWIVDRFHPERAEGNGRRLNEDVMALSGGRREAVREYHVRRLSAVLSVGLAAGILLILAVVSQVTENLTVEGGMLQRPGYGEVSQEANLTAQVEDAGEERAVTVEVEGRLYTGEEAGQILEEAQKELELLFLGDNRSRDEVRTSLCFPSSLKNGQVTVTWTTTPYGIISDQGELEGQDNGKVSDDGCLVEIEAELKCQDQTDVMETAVMVYPRLLSEEERLWNSVDEAVKKADEDSSQKAYLELPDTVEGRQISWSYQRNNEMILLMLLLLFLPAVAGICSDAKVRQKAQERREQMTLDYPELMWKMTMLLGAGLTIGAAFQRIAADYQKEKTETGKRYVYEEMLYTCREMKSGTAEAKAYENFGRRCGLPRYIKLGTLLSQNLKKGSRGLSGILEQEALSASGERRNEARKQGERAGTKMLLPMILMLSVVLIILVVPAFLSM